MLEESQNDVFVVCPKFGYIPEYVASLASRHEQKPFVPHFFGQEPVEQLSCVQAKDDLYC